MPGRRHADDGKIRVYGEWWPRSSPLDVTTLTLSVSQLTFCGAEIWFRRGGMARSASVSFPLSGSIIAVVSASLLTSGRLSATAMDARFTVVGAGQSRNCSKLGK